MVTFALGLLLAQGIDKSFVGVWATPRNEPFVIATEQSATFIAKGFFGYMTSIRTAPEGNLYGQTSIGAALRADPRRGKTPNAYLADVGVSASKRFNGFISYGAPVSGVITTLNLDVQDTSGRSVFGGWLSWVAPLSSITLAGRYAGQGATIDLNESQDGKSMLCFGRMTLGGDAYTLSGSRSAARAGFAVLEAKTGNRLGAAAAEWYPTAESLKAIKNRASTQSDRVALVVSFDGKDTAYLLNRQQG